MKGSEVSLPTSFGRGKFEPIFGAFRQVNHMIFFCFFAKIKQG
jgi:hypothetical protein